MRRKLIITIYLLLLMFPVYLFAMPLKQASAGRLSASLDFEKTLLEKGYKVIPLKVSKDKNFLFVNLTIGNKKTTKPFVIDTGSIQNSIDETLEKKYRFKKQGKKVISGGGGGNYFSTYKVLVPQMQISDFKIPDQLATIQHYSHIKVDKKHIGGMLGLNFLRQYHAIIDITNHRMFLQLNRQTAEKSKTFILNMLIKNYYELIRLNRSPKGYQTLQVKLNDEKPVQFMLDSGVGPAVMIDYNYSKNILLKMKGNPTIGKGSSSGIMKVFQSNINKLRIGKTETGHQAVLVTTGLEFAKIGTSIFGVIGLNWMRSHNAIIDTTNDLLFIK